MRANTKYAEADKMHFLYFNLSVRNHVTVIQLVRGPTLARLGSVLGRWNPIEQTGLCIYSCFAPTD
jgi:hypothetical protein